MEMGSLSPTKEMGTSPFNLQILLNKLDDIMMILTGSINANMGEDNCPFRNLHISKIKYKFLLFITKLLTYPSN